VLSPGDKVRDYEVIAPIRSGGMAMLYLARRRGVGGFSRLVALKLVHAHMTDDPHINRLFLQEARIAASIAHPNVVHVEEVGSVDGKYFIAMEYVHGVSLAELLVSLAKQRTRMTPKLCVWVAAQVSEALHAVHEATRENGSPLNIVHRDVSPQNVLVGHNGHIKLIDFGIAKSQLVNQPGSSRGSVIGKLRYMAPEQLRTEPVTRRTDVYALGVMLWEMLASRNLLRCFRIDDERDWQTREAPPPPSRYSTNLKASIDLAVLKAIACDPRARYESAMAFRAALLRAEPSASKVDAPAFAALLHKVLGDELERRRAHWPREVNVQLDSDVVSDTDRSFGVEELTVRLKPAELPEPLHEDEAEEHDEPTILDSSPFGDDRSEDETVVQRLNLSGERSLPRLPSVQAQIPTLGAPASTAQRVESIFQKLKTFTRRTGARGTVMVALLVALFAYAASSAGRLSSRFAEAASPAQASVAASHVTTSEPPTLVDETPVVSAAKPEESTPRLRSIAPAPKRGTPGSKFAKKKSKAVLSWRSRKARHPDR
jgi:serine/threonine-protein kinase